MDASHTAISYTAILSYSILEYAILEYEILDCEILDYAILGEEILGDVILGDVISCISIWGKWSQGNLLWTTGYDARRNLTAQVDTWWSILTDDIDIARGLELRWIRSNEKPIYFLVHKLFSFSG